MKRWNRNGSEIGIWLPRQVGAYYSTMFYQDPNTLCFLKVRVTTNYFPKFSPEELLATVGSCVGLWLGLGVVHIMDILVTTAGQFFSKLLSWK